MALFSWSKTASANATADSTINFQEGQAPSSVNDSCRAVMARLAEYRDDTSGAIVTGGTLNAYTVASNEVFDSLAHLNGQLVAFSPHVTNGATVTLAVDGLTAKPLRFGPALELQSGVLIAGTPYCAVYNSSDGAFYLQGSFANSYGVPLGGMMPYVGSTAPSSAFVFPFGQAVSQTTYATLFALVGVNAFGTDSGGNFSLPDLRGRVPVGLDNMGGSTASRITVAGGNYDATVRGGTGGAQNKTIGTANVPALTFAGTAGTATTGVNVPQGGAITPALGQGTGGTGDNIWKQGSFTTLNSAFTPAGTVNNGSANTALPIVPPSMALPYILRII